MDGAAGTPLTPHFDTSSTTPLESKGAKDKQVGSTLSIGNDGAQVTITALTQKSPSATTPQTRQAAISSQVSQEPLAESGQALKSQVAEKIDSQVFEFQISQDEPTEIEDGISSIALSIVGTDSDTEIELDEDQPLFDLADMNVRDDVMAAGATMNSLEQFGIRDFEVLDTQQAAKIAFASALEDLNTEILVDESGYEKSIAQATAADKQQIADGSAFLYKRDGNKYEFILSSNTDPEKIKDFCKERNIAPEQVRIKIVLHHDITLFLNMLEKAIEREGVKETKEETKHRKRHDTVLHQQPGNVQEPDKGNDSKREVEKEEIKHGDIRTKIAASFSSAALEEAKVYKEHAAKKEQLHADKEMRYNEHERNKGEIKSAEKRKQALREEEGPKAK